MKSNDSISLFSSERRPKQRVFPEASISHRAIKRRRYRVQDKWHGLPSSRGDIITSFSTYESEIIESLSKKVAYDVTQHRLMADTD